jgi:hypothetical protein
MLSGQPYTVGGYAEMVAEVVVPLFHETSG